MLNLSAIHVTTSRPEKLDFFKTSPFNFPVKPIPKNQINFSENFTVFVKEVSLKQMTLSQLSTNPTNNFIHQVDFVCYELDGFRIYEKRLRDNDVIFYTGQVSGKKYLQFDSLITNLTHVIYFLEPSSLRFRDFGLFLSQKRQILWPKNRPIWHKISHFLGHKHAKIA